MRKTGDSKPARIKEGAYPAERKPAVPDRQPSTTNPPPPPPPPPSKANPSKDEK